MRKRNCRIFTLFMAIIMILSCFTAESFAVSKKTGVVYTQVHKINNYAYCVMPYGLFKVDLNTSNVVKLVNNPYIECNLTNIYYRKGYVYYFDATSSIGGALKRVKATGGNKKALVGWATGDYTFSGSKLYAQEYYDYHNNVRWRYKQMNPDGRNKKKTSVKVKIIHKKSNVEGYRVVYTDSKEFVKTEYDEYWDEYTDVYNITTNYYLKTPDDSKIFLGKHTYETYD